MTVLVAGGAGFVGLALVEVLLSAGRDVLVLDRQAPPDAALASFARLPGRLDVALADVTDAATVRECIGGRPLDAAFLGIAVTSGAAREAADPRRVLEVNLIGLVNLLDALQATPPRRIVNLSSASAYGAFAYDAAELDEDGPTAPEALYGTTKLASEGIGRRLGELWGLPVTSVRLTAIFGPWERDTGMRDTLSPQMQVARAALAGEEVVLPRPGMRDWTYSRDTAAALLGLLEVAEPGGGPVNVGCGRLWSVADWCDALSARLPLRWRMAAPGEAATIDFHGPRDRRPVATRRLAALLGPREWRTGQAAADDLADWLATHRGMWT